VTENTNSAENSAKTLTVMLLLTIANAFKCCQYKTISRAVHKCSDIANNNGMDFNCSTISAIKWNGKVVICCASFGMHTARELSVISSFFSKLLMHYSEAGGSLSVKTSLVNTMQTFAMPSLHLWCHLRTMKPSYATYHSNQKKPALTRVQKPTPAVFVPSDLDLLI